MSFIAKSKRPLLAFALVLGVAAAAGTVSAADFCDPCAQPTYVAVAPPAPILCDACATSGITRTNLPGWYSDDYDYTVSSQRDTGITYLIPAMNGFYESHTIPLTNPVDRYYATHEVRNGQVVDTSGELALR